MLRLYWTVFILSGIAAVLAMIPAVVFIGGIYTFGLPLFPLAANLWWVMILLGPVVYSARAGKLGRGIAVSMGLAAVVAGGFYALRAGHLRQIAAPEIRSMPEALAGRMAASVEIRDDNDRGNQDAPCDALCEGLLVAGADWVRVAGWGQQGAAEDQVFRRAKEAECRAFDPDFPLGAPCILWASDDGRAADLLVRVEVAGDGHVVREDLSGLAFVISSHRLSVTDQRSGEVLHDQVARRWMQAKAPVPLMPNAGFDGNGLHGGGLTFLWERRADAMPDTAKVLAALGQPVSPAREWVVTKPALLAGYAPEGYWVNLPQDRALLLSILRRGEGELPSRLVAQVIRWMQAFMKGAPLVPADRAVLRQLPGRLPAHTVGLEFLMQRHPEMFVDSMADLYRMVREGDENQSVSAAATLLDRGRSNPPGTLANEAKDYLAALESGRQWGYLIQNAGRYGFDPTPIFQREVESPRNPKDGPDVYILFSAACHSDPKWAATLGPFVHDLAVSLIGGNGQNLRKSRDRLRMATKALVRLGQRDLAIDLRNQVNPETLATEYAENYTSAQPPKTADALQDVFFGRLDGDCR